MLWITRHAIAFAVIALATAAIGAVFVFARPGYDRHVSIPKDAMPPYTKVSYRPADARRVFAQEGISLTPRSSGSMGTTLGNRRDVLEVDIFGDPLVLKNAGFHDLVLGRNCNQSSRLAERWRGNIRVIVDCSITSNGQRMVDHVQRALSRLSTTS